MWFLTTAAVGPVLNEDAQQLWDKTGLTCVGRFRHMGSIYKNPTHDKFDEHFSTYLMESSVEDTFPEYGVCRPTVARELKAVSRYGLPTVDLEPSKEDQVLLLDWMEKEFGPYVEGYRVLDFEEVEIQGATTPGIPYKWFYRKKRDVIEKCPDEFHSFWAHAHEIGYPVVWHNFVKEELLPTTKLEENNVRSITGPDVAYFASFGRLCQDFNKRLYDACLSTASTLGFNKFEGGLNRIAEYINFHPHKEEADMSKFDARQVAWIRRLCMKFRWRMLKPEDQTRENWRRLEYYYSQAINSYLVTGLGFVLHADHGMKSGDVNTTPDNTLIHFLALAYAYIKNVSRDYYHFRSNVRVCLYGDDELISMSDEVVDRFCASARAPHYEACGIHFKVEATRESLRLEGLTFLGNRFKRDSNGHWVGEPVDPRKLVASALKPLKKQTPGQSMARVIALSVEGYWNNWSRKILWGFVQYMLAKGVQPDPDIECEEVEPELIGMTRQVPTLRKIRSLWLGYQ